MHHLACSEIRLALASSSASPSSLIHPYAPCSTSTPCRSPRSRQMVHLLRCSSSSVVVHTLLLFLFLTSSREVAFSDARRSPVRLVPEGTGGTNRAAAVTAEKKQEAAAGTRAEATEEGRRRALIGSRPPRCERACMSCGHCEAVQVPIVPQEEEEEEERARASAATLAAAMFTYRVDGVANYKPLSWKCRCGGAILDP